MRANEFLSEWFGSKPKVWEDATSNQVLSYIKKIHPKGEFRIDQAITDHPDWELTSVPLSSLHIDIDDVSPYGQINYIDYDHVENITKQDIKNKPIVVDNSGWIIDGNHRAVAARDMGMTHIPAYVPVESDDDQETYDQHMARIKQVNEAKLPRAVEDFLYGLTPEDVGVDEIGPWRIHYEGFTDDCQSSADYRKNPEAVYQQVFADHIAREGGRKPVEQNFTGDEDYPILYSIFRIPKQVKELFDRPVHHEPTNTRTKQRFKTDVDGHEIRVHFNPKGDKLEVDFYVDGRGFAVNNTIKNPSKVFSAAVRTIIDRLPDAVARYKPKTVWYKAVGNDESRVSLYKKLLSVFQQSLGSDWQAKTFKNGGWQFYELDHQVNENFADGKGPGRPGDSQRHGIPKGATIAQLEKARHAKGRKGQLARWQLNMRRGKKK